MRYWMIAAALVFALAGCQTKKKTNEPAPDTGTESGKEDPVWREDQKSGEKTGEKQPADTTEKPADTGEQKSSDSSTAKGDEPAPAKVDSQPKDPPPPDTTTPTEPAKVDKPADPAPGPKEPADPKAHEKLADEFVKAVKGMVPQLEKSKSYAQFKLDNDAFSKKQDAAMEERRKGSDKAVIEQAWADAIKAWYDARYSLERFRKLHSNTTGFETVSINSWNDVKALRADHLRSNDCRKANAASTIADPHRKELNMFRTTILKYDLTANEVFESKDWAKVFSDSQKRYEDCEQGKFDEADLKKFKD